MSAVHGRRLDAIRPANTLLPLAALVGLVYRCEIDVKAVVGA